MKRLIAALIAFGVLGSGSAMAGGFDHHRGPHQGHGMIKTIVVKAPARPAHRVVKVRQPVRLVKIIKVVPPRHHKSMHARYHHHASHRAWR